MKRKMAALALLLALLPGCTAQPPTPTPSPVPTPSPAADGHSMALDVDGSHPFWVELTDTDKAVADGRAVSVSIYEKQGDPVPAQTFEDVYYTSFEEVGLGKEDVNFDGKMDFCFPVSRGNVNAFYAFYVWDGEIGQFQKDPYGLNDLSLPEFDPDSGTVKAFWHSGADANNTAYYRYRDGALACVRRLCVEHADWDTVPTLTLMVEDDVDGVLTEVYRAPFDWDSEAYGERYRRWSDLEYHGKD